VIDKIKEENKYRTIKKTSSIRRVVDLFAGCGGMSLGFQNEGFEIVGAFENWDKAVETYKKNFDHPIFNRDLGDLKNIKDISNLHPDVIIGGPPCQDFSSAGHRDEKLGRADLTISYANIISAIKPQYFVMENVPRIRSSEIMHTIISIFKKAGYGLTSIVIDASRCGVPQIRKRFVMVGELGGVDDALKTNLENNQSATQMTMAEYFGDSLGLEYYFRVPRSYSRRGIYSINEPSMTIRGVDRPLPKGYPGHPADPIDINDKIRALTYKERSLVQTFPKTFIFEGSKTVLNQMIGNAVPVNLAAHIARSLKTYMNEKED